MKKKFNIPDLYQKVFGMSGVMFAIPALVDNVAKTAAHAAEFAAGEVLNDALYFQNSLAYQKSLYQGVQTIPLPTAPSIQSILGTPIYEQITLTAPAVVVKSKVTSPQINYIFPDWPLFDITAQYLIKKENVQGSYNGSYGTVKEMIQQDDFQITIRGFLINYTSQDYPTQLVNDLWAVVNAKRSLTVTNNVFNLLNIHALVIESVELPGVEGYMNIQPFVLHCLSDYPVMLQIKSVKTGKPIVPGQ
ncbi:DUF6046 domain-containing protein [Mucilaginibacter sp.]